LYAIVVFCLRSDTPPATLSLNNPLLQVMVAKSGAAPALLELCKSPGEDLREAAAVALWDLAYDCSLGREAIARAGEPGLSHTQLSSGGHTQLSNVWHSLLAMLGLCVCDGWCSVMWLVEGLQNNQGQLVRSLFACGAMSYCSTMLLYRFAVPHSRGISPAVQSAICHLTTRRQLADNSRTYSHTLHELTACV
jgi:hypothetical protein